MARVSVCITTYNHELYIERCIESVLAQGADLDIEIIIGVDPSPDNTGNIVQRLSDLNPGVIKPIIHATRRGASENLKEVLLAANGDYIAQLDGDDYWFEGKLFDQLKVFSENPEVIAVYTGAKVVNRLGETLGDFSDSDSVIVDAEQLVKGGNFLNTSSMMYKASAKNLITDIAEEFIDFRMHVRLAAHGEVRYVKTPLVAYRYMTEASMISVNTYRVCCLYSGAYTDAELLGLSETAITAGLKRVVGVVFRDSLISGRIGQIVEFYHAQSKVFPTIFTPAKAVGMNLFFLLSLPFLVLTKLKRRLSGTRVFYPVNKRCHFEKTD